MLGVVVPNILTDIYLLSIPLPVRFYLTCAMFSSSPCSLTQTVQLLWGVSISIRRKLTLMFLFSGALFIIMAGTIRAVVILTVSFAVLSGVPEAFEAFLVAFCFKFG